MKAILLVHLGLADTIVYDSIPTPVPQEDEALIQVKYCGVNHLDLLIQEGKRPGPVRFPHILGSEAVGVIEKIESRNKRFNKGDWVTVYPWTFCGKCLQCLRGNENICDRGGTFGRTQWGGFAEYMVSPIQNLVPIPQTEHLKELCALTLTGTTAHHLIDRLQIPDKSPVLVTGATGGVGTILIQLLKNKKCTVVCAISHKIKEKYLKKLSVDQIVSLEHLIPEVKKIFPQGVGFAVDIVGGDVWTNVVDVLAKNARMVFCATTLDGNGSVDISSAFFRQISLLGCYGGMVRDLKKVIRLFTQGKIKPVINSIYPLQDASKALEKLRSQKITGKILLEI